MIISHQVAAFQTVKFGNEEKKDKDKQEKPAGAKDECGTRPECATCPAFLEQQGNNTDTDKQPEFAGQKSWVA